MIKICFVCTGNICRSPMAEFIMKQMVKELGKENEFDIFSRALTTEEIGNDIYAPAKRILEQHGVDYHNRTAKLINEIEFMTCKYIIYMDGRNYSSICQLFPNRNLDKVIKLTKEDIADPWYTGDFDTAFNEIKEGVSQFLSSLHIM